MNDKLALGQCGHGSNPPPTRTGRPITLVFACAALGFVASALQYERVVAGTERNRAELLAMAYSTAQGQLEDFGRFLSDPHTRLISLAASESVASKRAVIAWNAADRTGYFLCDDLPVLDSGTNYELWALHGSDDPVKLASIGAKPGDSIYPLGSWPVGSWRGIEGKIRVEVTAGPRSVAKTPVFSGEIE